MMSIFIAKIKTEEANGLFVLTKYDDEKEMRLQILDIEDSKAYVGCVSVLELRSMAAELRMAFKLYMQETLSAFSVTNDDHRYLFELINCGKDCTIKWKKKADESIKIHLGEMTVEHVNFASALWDMLSTISKEMAANTKSEELSEKLEDSKKELSKTHELLTETLDVKEHLENELYSKFAVVLNSKKRKIRELCETVEKLKATKGVKKKPPVNGKHQTNHVGTSGEFIDDPGPSNNTKKKYDTSLILSDEDVPPPPKLCKPRIRQKEQAPSDDTLGTSSRKSTRTQKISEIEDVDGLLEII